MDFDNISNQELIQALTDRGVTVGGINSTTRNLYVKKLKNLVAAGDGTYDQLNGDGDNGKVYADVVEDHLDYPPPVQNVYPVLEKSTPRQRSMKAASREPESEESDYGEETSRILSEEELRMIREDSFARRSPARANETSSFYTLLKILIIVLVVVFLYFLLDNAHKSAGHDDVL